MRSQKNMSIRLAVVDGKKVEDTFSRIGRTGEQAFERIERSTKPASMGLKAVDTTARALNNVFRQAAGLVAAYAGISGIISSVRSVNETGMAFQGLGTALETITGSSADARAEMKFLEEQAERLGLNLLETAQSYMQIAAAAKGTELAGDGTRQIFTAIAEASTVLQLSVDQTNGALRAIGQIMSKGKVQAEELRGQLGERLYGAFQLAARGMGITTAELDKMLEQGQVIAEDFLPKFAAEIRKTFSDGVPAASMTARAEMNRFNNAILEIERTIAASGFLDGVTQGYRTLTATLEDPAVVDAARELGQTLGSAIATAAEGLAFLIENADLAVTAIGGLVIARTVAGAVTLLNASIAGNAGLIVGLHMANSISTAFAIRLVAVEAATKLATLAMVGFRSALMLVGGPVGLAVLAGIAVLKLASGHDAAAKAARDHATELKEIKEELGKTAEAASDLSEALSESESVYRFTKQLETAKENIIDLQKELKFGGIGGFWDQFSRFGKPLQHELYQIRQAFNQGKLSATEYSEALFKLATKYPDFGEQAEEVQQQVFALLAAERAAKKAAAALDELRNPKAKIAAPDAPTTSAPAEVIPELSDADKKRITDRITELHAEEQALQRLNTARTQGEAAVRRAMVANEQDQALRRLGLDVTGAQSDEQKEYANQIKSLVGDIYKLQEADKNYQDTIRENNKLAQERERLVEDVRQKYDALDMSLSAAIKRAGEWRNEALLGLDSTKAGYADFAAQVDAVYNDMIAKARDEDLQNSKRWEDGIKRGLQSVIDEADDMASKAERGVTSMFKSMEDALVSFVTTGKLDFKSMADSIIADMVRMQIQSSITKPLAGALSGFLGDVAGSLFGSPSSGASSATAHTGGVIGADTLRMRSVSPSVFANAPRFHTGGIVGNEVPIIAKQGEAVFTPGQMKLLGGALQSKPNVSVSVRVENNVSNAQARADVSRDSTGNMDLKIIIEEVEGNLSRNIGRGEGLAPTLERRYGLNPAAGSYR
ncbi:MAG TPA: tape measure protein [Alphaproteobacteria bacterium]|nr:tape measure protein [Alphaproteobacteria bacterium]